MGTVDLLTYIALTSIAILSIAGMVWAFFNSKPMAATSLFNRLFIIVAVTSAFFSAVSSAIGFGLITSQESADFFRNFVLPPAFGVYVFLLVSLSGWGAQSWYEIGTGSVGWCAIQGLQVFLRI